MMSLRQVSTVTPVQGESYLTFSMFRELSARQQVFTSIMGAWGNTGVTVDDGGTVVKGLLWAATGNVYEELGVRPVVGRLLGAGDMTVDLPAAEPVAVLGYGFWQRHYRGNVSVVGRTIRVEGVPFTVVGIAPAGFTGFALVTADRRRVIRDVVRDGLTVTVAGLAVGIVAALATVRVVETLLFGVTPQDPLTLAAAAASLITIAILACTVPASRAARVDPMIALRGE
jgi:hypothetical protein